MNNSKKFIIFIFIFLFFLSIISVSFDFYGIKINAEGTQINDYILSDNITVLPYDDNTYILVSSNDSSIKTSIFDSQNSKITSLFDLSCCESPLFSASVSKNKAYIARNSGNDLAITSFTSPFNFSNAETKNIETAIIEKSDDFAVLSNGQTDEIFTKAYKIPNEIKCISENSQKTLTIECTLINSIKSDLSKTSLYIFADNKVFKFIDDGNNISFNEILCDEDVIAPVSFINDDTIMDANSKVFRFSNENNSLKLKPVFCSKKNSNQNFACLCNNQILSNVSSKLLYLLNYENGNPCSQKEFNGDVLSVCANNNYVLAVTKEINDVYLNYLDSASFSKIEETQFNLNNASQDSKTMTQAFVDSYPKQSNVSTMYLITPDCENFSTTGEVSLDALNDGLRAINFYRELYSLNPLAFDTSLCSNAQYASMLALVKKDLSDSSKPPNMSDDFFNKACAVFDIDCILKNSTFSKNSIPNAVHSLFNSNCRFRNIVLSKDASSIGFGLSNNQGGSSVFINLNNRTTDYKNDTFSAFPKDGCYPLNWLSSQTNTFSVKLNSDNILAGFNGQPLIKITNSTSNESYEVTGNVSDNNTLISFEVPKTDFENASNYTVSIKNLCTTNGIAAYIEYPLEFIKVPMYGEDDPDDPQSDLILSDVYNIDVKNKLITGIYPATTVSAFKSNLTVKPGYYLKFLNYKGNDLKSGNVGTNTKVIILNENGQIADEYYILIYGEVTGEGNINSRDTNSIYNLLLNKNFISGIYLLAADINHDSYVNALDVLLLEKYINSEYSIDQKGKIAVN